MNWEKGSRKEEEAMWGGQAARWPGNAVSFLHNPESGRLLEFCSRCLSCLTLVLALIVQNKHPEEPLGSQPVTSQRAGIMY